VLERVYLISHSWLLIYIAAEYINLKPAMVWFGFIVFNATFNNISVISWWSVVNLIEVCATQSLIPIIGLGLWGLLTIF